MKFSDIVTIIGILNFVLFEEVSLEKNSTKNSQILIIGAGASGITAASKLFENGFNNITILEAEDRIGGSIYTTKMGEYLIDFGQNFVVGENNIIYELAWPLGVLEHEDKSGNNKSTLEYFGSSGVRISLDTMFTAIYSIFPLIEDPEWKNIESIGELHENKLNRFFQNHSELNSDQRAAIRKFMKEYLEVADDTLDIPINGETYFIEGDAYMNWKDQGYEMILDIIMKKYPNPEEELPVMNNIILNSKVTKINYNMSDGIAKVLTKDGREYSANHVIFTGSLGVLKVNSDTLFDPPLSDRKIKAIQTMGIHHIGKIFLYYEKPWWINGIYFKGMFWTEEDRKEIENNPETRWMLSVYGIIPVDHKPKLLLVLLSGSYVHEMELLSDYILHDQILKLLDRFFGSSYNITEPLMIHRSNWNTNENFCGIYAYQSIASTRVNVTSQDLAYPILNNNDKPILQFAGAATTKYSPHIQGAIESGIREANRLIEIYSLNNTT